MGNFSSKTVENSPKNANFSTVLTGLSTVFTVENVEYFQFFFTISNRLVEINFTASNKKYQPRQQEKSCRQGCVILYYRNQE